MSEATKRMAEEVTAFQEKVKDVFWKRLQEGRKADPYHREQWSREPKHPHTQPSFVYESCDIWSKDDILFVTFRDGMAIFHHYESHPDHCIETVEVSLDELFPEEENVNG